MPTPEHALVTGASSGIGAALARRLAARGQPLVLTARREDRLRQLADQLGARVPCIVLPADLAEPGAPAQLVQQIAERGLPIGTLVNNAGYGLPGAFHASPWSAHAAFLQVMVTAVCELSHRLLPAMRERGRGEILNIASLAGHLPGSAGHTLYAASKAFMVRFSESLALENRDAGVRVCALCPGFTYSEFHDVTGTRAQVSRMPRWLWQDADTVAAEGLAALERGAIVHVTGRANRIIKTLVDLLPDRAALALVRKQSKHFRKV